MIPKIVHLTWKTKDIFSSTSPLIQNGIVRLRDMNPDWVITVYDDQDIKNYLKEFLSQSDFNLIEKVHVVGQSDLWRLVKLYNEGGLYLDIDRLYNVSLSNITGSESIRWVLPTYLDHDFSHDIMLTSPGNPAFLKAIELHLERRRQGVENIYYLGPQTYMHAVTHCLMGEIIDSNPGIEVFEKIRNRIEHSGFITTFRETSPLNTIVYRDDGLIKDHEEIKRAMYKDFNLKHWTGEW